MVNQSIKQIHATFLLLLFAIGIFAQAQQKNSPKPIHILITAATPFDTVFPPLYVCLTEDKTEKMYVESFKNFASFKSDSLKLCTETSEGAFSIENPDTKKYKYVAVSPAYRYQSLSEMIRKPRFIRFFKIEKTDTQHITLTDLPKEIVRDPSKPPMAEKPVIYLYPTQLQKVSVQLDVKGKLTTTYPAYNKGWEVIAQPDGTLQNTATGKQHPYLFWEADIDFSAQHYHYKKGFCVKGENTLSFLEETLAQLGLNPRESTDFITYWLPRMQNNPFNLIHFWVNDNYDNASFLNINPKPDSELRIMMEFTPLANEVEIAPQQFTPFVRKGFSVVEWGGVEVMNRDEAYLINLIGF